MSGLVMHGECGKRWKQRGNRTGHCAACHETFEGVTLFDAHRRGGVCADPAGIVVAGAPLTFDPTFGNGAWSARNTFAEALARADGFEAVNAQNENRLGGVSALVGGEVEL